MIKDHVFINIAAVFFAFIRVNALLSFLPVFGDQTVPLKFRIGLSSVLAVFVIGDLKYSSPLVDSLDIFEIIDFVLSEIIVGICIGFVSKICLDTVIVAASLVATQMGFGADKLFIPDFSGELDSFTAFHRMLIHMLFLSLNLHFGIVIAIKKSFDIIPLFNVKLSKELVLYLINQSGDIFLTSMQLAAPILIAILISTAALGILSRSVPQLNIFAISYAINFLLGMVIYIATLTMFPDWVSGKFEENIQSIYRLMIFLKR